MQVCWDLVDMFHLFFLYLSLTQNNKQQRYYFATDCSTNTCQETSQSTRLLLARATHTIKEE